MTSARSRTGIRFCLVTAGNISSRPRLVKAADALYAAGHDVRVVALDVQAIHRRADASLMRGRPWTLASIALRRGTVRGTVRRAMAAGGQAVARHLWRWGGHGSAVADRALSRYLSPLARRAGEAPADVVIAHGVAALPAAARAATRLGARVAFDSEDLHTGELPDEPAYERDRALVADVERRYLGRCSHVTASSSGIADALVQAYGIARPVVILNAFSRTERDERSVVVGEGHRPTVSLYWFSQVIGPGRGLEDAVDALPLIDQTAQLHLRGQADPAFVTGLLARARSLGVADRVFIWPLALPSELVALAGQHDIGLALEPPNTRNHDLCVSNKLFVYLLAGLAVAASDTTGQRGIMDRAPGAGFTYPSGNAPMLAAGIRGLIATPGALARAQAAAARVADDELSWDGQAAALVAYLAADRRPGDA